MIILDKEYAYLVIVVMALELVPASKRLLGIDIPQGNTELRGHGLPLVSTTPNQSIHDRHEPV